MPIFDFEGIYLVRKQIVNISVYKRLRGLRINKNIRAYWSLSIFNRFRNALILCAYIWVYKHLLAPGIGKYGSDTFGSVSIDLVGL